MANAERGEVALPVGDRVYTLVLDLNANCEIEELLSTPTEVVTTGQVFIAAAHGSQRHARALLWGALRRHHPDVSVKQAGDLIQDVGGVEKFFETLASLRKRSEAETSGRPPKARRSKAGARSTSTPNGSA